MELESYTSVVLRRSLRELLSSRSPLWPEVKVFLSICKTASQRLPPEVQVWNMMNVRKGLRRLLRLSPLYGATDTPGTGRDSEAAEAGRAGEINAQEHDPRQVALLLRWIVERSEIAAAYGLQRLRIGHQVNWISALLASLARIRQFCVEILDKLEKKTVKHSTAELHIDEGVPLDRNTFVRLRAGRPADGQLNTGHVTEIDDAVVKRQTTARIDPTSEKGARHISKRHRGVEQQQVFEEAKMLANADLHGSDAEDEPERSAGNTKQAKHPIILELRGDIKKLMKGKSSETKASLKRIYCIALKRSRLCTASDDRAMKKLCRIALKKAQATVCK